MIRKTVRIPLIMLLAATAWAASPARRPEPPIITPDGGHYDLNATVRVSIRAERGARIVYTLDGSPPEEHRGIKCESNAVFFDLPPGDVTVHAIAVRQGMPKSNARRAKFTRSSMRTMPNHYP